MNATTKNTELETIRCPHCDHQQDLDNLPEYDELVTLWGDYDWPREITVVCQECEEIFHVHEHVRRTFTASRIGEESPRRTAAPTPDVMLALAERMALRASDSGPSAVLEFAQAAESLAWGASALIRALKSTGAPE